MELPKEKKVIIEEIKHLQTNQTKGYKVGLASKIKEKQEV